MSSPEQQSRASKYQPPSRTGNVRGSLSSTGGFGNTGRRSSIEERAKEILEKARAAAPKSRVEEEPEPESSLQATFAQLLEGIEIPKERKESLDLLSPASVGPPTPSSRPVMLGDNRRKASSADSADSSYGDSFELSAADLEVGTFAAKRTKEKTAERGRRMSFDQPSFKEQKELSAFAKMSANSPDPVGKRRSLNDFQMSTALSSIQRSRSFGNEHDLRRYGNISIRCAWA